MAQYHIRSPTMRFCNSGRTCGPNYSSRYVLVSESIDMDPEFDFFRKYILSITNEGMRSSFAPSIDDFVDPNNRVYRAETSGIRYYESDGTQREIPLTPYTKCHLRLTYCVPEGNISRDSFDQWL